MEFDISRFRETFFQEADEHLAAMESGLLQLEGNPDPELLNGIFRGAHSIKGASGTFGFEDVARFAHGMEGPLERMRSGAVAPSASRIGLLLESLDTLRLLLDGARNGAEAPPETATATQSLFVAQRAGEYQPGAPAPVRVDDRPPARWSVRFAPAPEILRQGMDPPPLPTLGWMCASWHPMSTPTYWRRPRAPSIRWKPWRRWTTRLSAATSFAGAGRSQVPCR